MNIEIRDDTFKKIVDPNVSIQQLATGFEFTEGPVWNPIENALIFSDMPGNIMRKWTVKNGVETFRQPSNMANGNFFDSKGRLITCEHATSRVVRTELNGSITILASHYDKKELNSPNDLIVRKDGLIYFTDPSFGRMEYYGVPREQELDFCGLYNIEPESKKITLLSDDFIQPNGLCFSLDEKKLFVNDSAREHIRSFIVSDDGSLSEGKVWTTVFGEGKGVPDGMKIDSLGNICTTGPGGIHYFNPSGKSIGVIKIPESVSNFTWGDEDMQTMYITASTSLYKIRTLIPGNTIWN